MPQMESEADTGVILDVPAMSLKVVDAATGIGAIRVAR